MKTESFEWDDNKSLTNIEKHGISFELASEVFADKSHISIIDARKEYGETRHVTIGKIADLHIVVVVHTDRQNRIRIISARKANAKERTLYNDKLKSQKTVRKS